MSKLSGPMMAPANGGAADTAVVLLHGYGSDGNDLIGLAPHWQGVLPSAVFVSPNAPEPVGGMMSGYQWFAIDWDPNANRVANRQTGVTKARPILVEFLNDLWSQSGIAPNRTILGGFSQGAMMALHTGLSLPREQQLMGIIAASGAFLPPDDFGSDALAKPPVCLVHGDMDAVVDPNHSADANRLLSENGFDVHFHISRGLGHGISPDGLDYMTKFISTITQK